MSYDVCFSIGTRCATETSRVDVLLSLTVTEDGWGFYDNASTYHALSPDDGEKLIRPIVEEVAKRMWKAGLPIKPTDNGFTLAGLDYDQLCAVEQYALLAAEKLGDLGWEHGKRKGLTMRAMHDARGHRRAEK